MVKRSKSRLKYPFTVPPDGEDTPTNLQTFRAAVAYVGSGLSLIPIRADGTKMPAFGVLPRVVDADGEVHRPWGGYRLRPPTAEELKDWFLRVSVHRCNGLAVLAGNVSGNLEIVDLDNWEVVEPWSAAVNTKAPGLLDRLVRVQTPRPGMHVYFRCPTIGTSEKLAMRPDPADPTRPKTLIEVKGEGGYCLAPPSPPNCHPTRRMYRFVGALDLTRVPIISAEERAVLHDAARSLNQWTPPPRPAVTRPLSLPRTGRPGDDFNARADWNHILEPHGWSLTRTGIDGTGYWCRPGKTDGTSATTEYGDSGLLYIFSSNADPFEPDTSYSKFAAYTLLNHKGNFQLAAAALREQGYGPSSHGPGGLAARYRRYRRQL